MEENACCIQTMVFYFSPVVRCAMESTNSDDLPKIVDVMQRLVMSDPMVLCSTKESGECIIAASGELPLVIC